MYKVPGVWVRISFLALLALLAPPLVSFAGPDINSANYRILSPTIAPGGYSVSASYTLSGTAGETAHGTSTSASYSLNLGFFSFPVVTAPVLSAVVGNASGRVDLSWTAAIPYLGYTVSQYDIGTSTTSGGPYAYTQVGNVLTYNDTGLTNDTPYYFVVRALDNANIPIATSSEITATPIAPSLTFVIDSGTQNLPTITPGSLVATSSILQVKSNNTTGFAMTALRSNASATLIHSDTTTTITDKTDWIAPSATTTLGNATASTTQPLTLQFRVWRALTDTANYSTAWWGSDDTTSGALFAGVPSTTQTIVNRSVAAVSTTTTRVLYDLNVPLIQKTGTYSGDVIYSVLANP